MANRFWMKAAALFAFAAIISGSPLSGSGSAAVVDEDKKDAAEAEETDGPTLTIGSKAPSIDVEHWVSDGNGKFKPVTEFEADKVYVVEFWATWCGPCVASMPHLAETQNKFLAKGVQIISISDEDLETVNEFLERPVRGAKKPAATEESEDEDKEETKKKSEAATYGELTSAYCLTTDPDGSVKTDYMEAAGQNGIPTSFIVGKTGLIEWIGHPMSMDEPLAEVVSGKWDREAFLEEFRKEQERDLLMAKLSQKMRKGDTEGALTLLDDAIANAEGDEETVSAYQQLKFRVRVSSAATKIQGDEVEEGLAELDEISKDATDAEKSQISMLRINLLLSKGLHEDVMKTLTAMAESEMPDSSMLNQLSWQIYEAAVEDKEFPKELITAATAAAEKAVEGDPENGMVLDTLAHLLHLQGDLDRAIELQTKAVDNAGDAPESAIEEMSAFLKKIKKEKAAQ
ncbi:MAG: redoxin domain-containing protein [Planctomycetaceae bacterium]